MLRLSMRRGRLSDYLALRRFHYCAGRPATVAAVWCVWATLRPGRRERAAVLVVSYPVPCCAERHRVFGIGKAGLAENLRWVNANLRTVSRLVVHPRYRGLGLATRLIRHAVRNCPTPFLEARSQLGHTLPLFTHAGMHAGPVLDPARPRYFWVATQTRADRRVGA